MICDDGRREAARCVAEVSLPGPGTYQLEVELTPIGEDARRYVYRLPIARDAITASLELDVASTAFPDTAWLGSIWLDVERPHEADGMRIDVEGFLHVGRRVLWRYAMVSVERLDGEASAEGPATWCGLGPRLGELVWVEPDEPANLRGSSDRTLRTGGPTRISVVVHVPIALGSSASRRTARPRLRRTERRTVVR